MNVGIRNINNTVINNRMNCKMNILTTRNINIRMHIHITINTNPTNSITNAPAAGALPQAQPLPQGLCPRPSSRATPVARVVAIHEGKTAARPSQSM